MIEPLILNIDQLINLTVDPFAFSGDLELFNVSGNVTSLYS